MRKSFGAIIAAGGTGTRFGSDIPKQFVDVLGVPVIAHTISKFQNCSLIDEIVLVVHKDYIVFCNDVVKKFRFDKVSAIIGGGATRQKSVFKGIKEIGTDYVLIHDAARPNVSCEQIEKCCRSVAENGACALGCKVVDTIKFSQDGVHITKTIDRTNLWQIQTPQCFERDTILRCHQNAAFDSFEATDDCMLAEHYGVTVSLVEGDSTNIKITNYSDLVLAEVFLGD